MQQPPDNFDGAVVNNYQLQLLLTMFRINPWSYMNENPFELTKQLEEQERAMERLGLS